MNLDTVHVVQRFHPGGNLGRDYCYFVMKITEGSACMGRHF